MLNPQKPSPTATIALLRLSPCLLALLWAGCSDPSENVHRSTASAPTDVSQTAATAASVDYVVRSGSTISFVGSKVTGSHDGGFNKFEGTVPVADGKITGTPVIRIDMDSTWSDNNRLTGHLKNADFFDVPTYPFSTFTVTSVSPQADKHLVTGNLDLHGVTKSVSFPADVRITPEELTLKAEFALNRKDFNINYTGRADDLIRDNVVIRLDLKASPGPARPEDRIAP
ncbi:MAG: YceI family protein [Verrucomicrobiae bacterium]|nr:YceI family protein [Verrucomicrobiae bacterium]